MKKTTIIESIVVLYVILFLYTGISKLMEYSVFKQQLADSPILAPVSKPIALGLPWLEFLITVLLVIPKWRLKGLYSTLILMTLFTIYIIAILLFSTNIPCSCGGILAELSWKQHVIFNCIFIALSVLGINLQKRNIRDHKIEWSSIKPQELSY
jgi:hypothetical protein